MKSKAHLVHPARLSSNKSILRSNRVNSRVARHLSLLVGVSSLEEIKRPHSGEDTLSHGHISCEILTYAIRMGELEPWIDENFVRSVWYGMGYQVNVKMIRDKFSGFVLSLLSAMTALTFIS